MENQSIFRAVDISRKLNVSRASVTEALKKLVTKGYITYDRHDSIALTSEGKKLASSVASKHTILQNFFEKVTQTHHYCNGAFFGAVGIAHPS